MTNKIASYRLQFNPAFTFRDAGDILSYLDQLGISHIYASPILKPVHNSSHGYDVVSLREINPQLGGEKEFSKLINKIKKKEMGWIQDIVPNHMAFHNQMLHDVLRYGKKSKYYNYFDIDWSYSKFKGKVLAPFLGTTLNKAIEDNEIKLVYEDELKIAYYEHKFPVSVETHDYLRKILQEKGIVNKKTNPEKALTQTKTLQYLTKNYLNNILSMQNFKLSYWKTAAKSINYRRFFSVNDLICLNTEKVIDDTHSFLFSILNKHRIDAVRIDHIDGLHNPSYYINKLRKNFSGTVYAEKILEKNEQLPPLNIDSTTGYEFLNYLNWLFVDKKNEKRFTKLYKEFTGETKSYENILISSKKKVIDWHFSGDLQNLTNLFSDYIDCDKTRLRKALRELLAVFSVYRTYITSKNSEGYSLLNNAIEKAKRKPIEKELEMIKKFLNKKSKDSVKCVMRLQQFTGPIMAKGLEDTALYRYKRLISLNEVGGNPGVFGILVDEFHDFNKKRKNIYMNATSTHDTKRGEDARARLNALSCIPGEMFEKINHWHRINKPRIDTGMEYYIYCTMLGSFPVYKGEQKDFIKRLKEHVIKASREAKEHTCWLSPDFDYENKLVAFIDKAFINNKFMDSFTSFHSKVSTIGMYNSLSQVLIKCFSPGMPDFYQGSELWDFNMVDPDNRRTVDFEKRKKLVEEEKDKYNKGGVKQQLIKTCLQTRKEQNHLVNGQYIPLQVHGKYARNIVAFARKKGKEMLIVIAPRLLSDQNVLGSVWEDTAVSLPGKHNLYDKINKERIKVKDHIYIYQVFINKPVGLLKK